MDIQNCEICGEFVLETNAYPTVSNTFLCDRCLKSQLELDNEEHGDTST